MTRGRKALLTDSTERSMTNLLKVNNNLYFVVAVEIKGVAVEKKEGKVRFSIPLY